MAMSPATLAAQLLGDAPAATEADAVAALAGAYGVFAKDAAAGVPITDAGVSLGKAAMATALAGVSAPGAGASVLSSAVQAFWVAVAGGIAASFAGALAVVPPPNAGLSASLAVTFAANTSAAASKADATAAVAADMHAEAVVGGVVTFPGPVTIPIA